MKWGEAIDKFTQWKGMSVRRTTIKGYNLILRQFALFLRNGDFERTKISDVMEWFRLLEDLGWDRNSFLPRAMALRKIFEFYEHMGNQVIDPWLIPIPDKEYKIARVADDDGYRKLLQSIPTETNDPRHIRNMAFVRMLWDTGARNGELCSLDVDDLDLEEMKAVIKTEKSKGARPVREIFWTAETNLAIMRWVAKRETLERKMILLDKRALFISLCNARAGGRINIKGVGEMLRRCSNRAGIPCMNAHSFRHRMGHHIVRQGGSNSDVSNILGHSSLESSYVYTLMTNKELHSRYQRFMGGPEECGQNVYNAPVLEYDTDMTRPGRPINEKAALEVKGWLDKGLNQAQIARVMKKPRQQVLRWVKYLESGLVEPKENNVDKEKTKAYN